MPTPDSSPDAGTPASLPEARLQVRRALRILGRDLLILLVLAGLAEAALRRAGIGTGEAVYDAEFTGGKPIAINPQGFRGPEPPPAKAPGDLLLLAIGDSTTFGTGVAWDEAWPQACSAALASQRQGKVHAVNAGVAAGTLKELTWAIDRSWGDLHPDVVVLAVSNNMVSFAWIRRDDAGEPPVHEAHPAPTAVRRIKTAVNRGFRSLRLPEVLLNQSERAMYGIGLRSHSVSPEAPYGPLLAHGWRQSGLDPTISGEAWRCFERDLAQLRDRVRARNARFYVTAIPCRFMLSDDPADNEKRVPLERMSIQPGGRMEEICRRLDVPYVDALEALRRSRAAGGGPLYCPLDFVHLDPEGHRVVADAVARRVAQDLRPR